MEPLPKITVRPADWQVDRPILRAIREEVFVQEQLVPADMEWDEYDEQSHHVVAMAGDTPVAPGYGTRASTVMLMDNEGEVHFRERSFGEGGELIEDRRYRFGIARNPVATSR